MKTSVQVSDVRVTTVKPSEKTDHVKVIRPTFMDLIPSDCYFPTLFTYRLPTNSDADYEEFASQLKTSLEEVLVKFFPYAGRWVSDGGLWTVEGKRGFRLDCNDEGVPFIEAYVDKNIDSVVRAGGGFEVTPELNGHEILGMDSSILKQKMRPDGLPPLFTQLTRFRCGGVALAVTFSHMTCDADSFLEFMNSWAETARTGKSTIVPRVDREQCTSFENFVSLVNEDDFPVLRNMVRMCSPMGTISNVKNHVTRLYEVNASTVKKVKETAQAGGQYVSTNDCIVAQIWKLTASLPGSMKDEKPFAVCHLAEGRNRFCIPHMPHLIGNAWFPAVCPIPPTPELVNAPLHSLSQIFRKNLLQTDWANLFHMESFIGTLTGFAGDHVKLWLNTSWTKFDVYGVNFGMGGAPYFACGNNGNLDYNLLGASFVLPPVPSSSASVASVSIVNAPEVLDFMEGTAGFWDFFLPWEQQHEQQPAALDCSKQTQKERMDLPARLPVMEMETLVVA